MAENATVWILSPFPSDAGFQPDGASSQSVLFRNKVSVDALAKSLRLLVAEIAPTLDEVNDVGKDFALDELELSAVAGGDGSLTILGAEFGGRLEGAVKLVFRRRDHAGGEQSGR